MLQLTAAVVCVLLSAASGAQYAPAPAPAMAPAASLWPAAIKHYDFHVSLVMTSMDCFGTAVLSLPCISDIPICVPAQRHLLIYFHVSHAMTSTKCCSLAFLPKL